MLDLCFISFYIFEEVVEELELYGQELNLMIVGIGGVEVKICLCRVEFIVINLDGIFLSLLQVYVFDNIVGDILVICWLELKDKWFYFC